MSDPIRVLQLAKHFDPDTGGIETITFNIAEMLLRQNIRADVLCTEVQGPYTEREREYRVIRCKADLSFGNKRLSRRYVQLGRQLEVDYDCALVHLPNPLAVLATLKWRKPVILVWHADIPQAAIRWVTTPIDNRLLARAAAVIGPTPIHLECSHRANAIRNGVVIPFPFNKGLIPTATGQTDFADTLRRFRRDRAMSISIGRLVPYKGFDVLIEAARGFGEELCSLIVGSGPLEDELRQRIETAEVQDRVLLAGGLSPAELADAFAQAKLGVMPSITAAEMYGIAQVESMAAGLPMVSTNLKRSGVPFVNKNNETGLVVEPGDPKTLLAAMRRLVVDDPLWQRLSVGALRSIECDHDMASVGERYARLIRDVLSS